MTLSHHSFDARKSIKKTKFKSALLAGTALVGIGLFPSLPRSATITYTNTESDATNYVLTSSDTFVTVAGGNITAIQSGTLNLSGFAANLNALATTDQLTFSGVISGTSGVSINGSGTLVLSATNTYSGGTTLTSGTLILQGGSALADAGALTINGGILLLSASEAIGTLSGTGGTVTLGSNTLTVNQSAPGTYAGTITGTGSLTKAGTAALTLSGTNTYSGGTTINAGTLILSSGGHLSDTGSVTINGGTLQLNFVETIGSLSGTGGTIVLVPSAQLFINQSVSGTYSGNITGSDSIHKDGTATLTLSGTNTHLVTVIVDGTLALSGGSAIGDTGGVVVNGGTLQLNTSEAIGTLSGSGGTINLQSNTLTVNQTSSVTYSGTITGTGSLTKAGTAALTLSGTNTYTGGTTINSGTLRLLNSAGAGVGTITFNGGALALGDGVNNANALDLNADATLATLPGEDETATQSGAINTSADSSPHVLTVTAEDAVMGSPTRVPMAIETNAIVTADNLTISGVISGSGSLAIDGPGTVILSATNTYSGGTTIIEGILELANAAAAGTGTITFFENSETKILDLDNVTIANNISVPDTIMFDPLPKIVVDNGDSSGITGAIDLSDSVDFDISASSTLAISGNISGTGVIIKRGSGTLILSGTNTNVELFGRSLSLADGTVQLNSSTAAGAGRIAISGSGVPVLALSGGLTVANNINASGAFIIETLSGGTEVSTLSGDISGSGTITLTFNTFDAADSLTVSGVISGTTSLVKTGSGSLILSASSTYTGPTTINAGTLFNNGNLTSDILIAFGGTYGGTGSVTGNVTNSGTVAPGTSIGTTTVTGTVTFNGGSNLAVEFDASGNADLVNVTGSVTINSSATVTATPLGGGFSGQLSYTIIDTTGGITGTFDTLTFTDASFFGFLTHNSNSVVLTAGAVGSTFVENASTPNQSAIASALDGLDPNTNSDFGTIFVDFLMLGSAAQTASLDQMSGEGLGTLSSSTLATNDLRTQGIASHLNDARLNRSEGTAARASGTRYAQGGGGASVLYGKGVLWMQGYGGKATMDVGGGDFNAAGIDIGYDTWLGDDLLIGVTVGIARDRETGFANLASAEAEYINFGGHMALDSEPVYFHGIFAVGIGDFTTTRNIVFGTTNRTAMGSFDGLNATFYGEVGTDGRSGDYTFQPYVALNYSYIERDDYTETGAGSLNLMVAKESVHSLQGILGVRAGTTWQAGDNMTIRPEIRARWVHELADGDMRRSMVNFVGSSASFATINDAAGFGDAFVFGTSFDISTGGSFHIVIGGDYLLSDEYDMWSGTGRLLWNF